MKSFGALLLSIWQEVGRHIEISDCLARVTPLLAKRLPVELVLLRHIDEERGSIETVAIGSISGEARPAFARNECRPPEMKRISRWCERKAVTRPTRAARLQPPMRSIIGSEVAAEVLVGPLLGPQGCCGILVLAAAAGGGFASGDRDLAEELLEPLSVALENFRRFQEIALLRDAAEAERRSLLVRLGRDRNMDEIVGSQSGLKAVMDRVELVARSDVPVLIFGETGSGKELVARAIHERSPRVGKAFIRVNCGAIPPELIDSELFGHERGAFTGAVSERRGWFERADQGTLFLDEIGDLPMPAQVRLLRILQDGWLERVGGHQPIHVDVRVVAATHRDLAAMAGDGRFREDLWYRLAVFPIILPPLRERREDIPDLVRHLAQRAAKRFGLPPAMPSPDDISMLAAYAWPGNVRELASVIDRAALLGDGAGLEVAKALGITQVPAISEVCRAVRVEPGGVRAEAPFASLEAVIRQHIGSALKTTRGRVEGPHGCAGILGVNPNTLRAKMRKLGIDWRLFRQQG